MISKNAEPLMGGHTIRANEIHGNQRATLTRNCTAILPVSGNDIVCFYFIFVNFHINLKKTWTLTTFCCSDVDM